VPESGGFHEKIERNTMGKYDKYVSVWSNIGALWKNWFTVFFLSLQSIENGRAGVSLEGSKVPGKLVCTRIMHEN